MRVPRKPAIDCARHPSRESSARGSTSSGSPPCRRLQPARLRPRAARGVPRALRGEAAARGADARHESGALRHGADGRAVRRRHDGARLPRIEGPVGKPPRASAAADRRVRLPPLGGERHALLGLGARSLRTAEQFFERSSSQTGARSCSWRSQGATARPTSCRGPSSRRFPTLQRGAARVAEILRPPLIVGIGGFAEKRAREALGDLMDRANPPPSPASPAANSDWPGLVDAHSAHSASIRRRSVRPMRRPRASS